LKLPGSELFLEGPADGPVLVMIRPEMIRLTAVDAATLNGKVERVTFVGDRQRVTIGGAARKPLAVDAPNVLVLASGERVGLSVDKRAIRRLAKPDRP
jgi:putative spermidine/putrescine transport system ATP-binding protein